MKTIVTLPAQVALSLLIACLLILAPTAAWAQSAAAKGGTREVLSVGWQAGYCAARPKSKGCAGFSPSADAAQRFSLVGRFQPRKSYCGIEAGLAQKAKKGTWTRSARGHTRIGDQGPPHGRYAGGAIRF